MSTITEPTRDERIHALHRAFRALITEAITAEREGREVAAEGARAAAMVIDYMKHEEVAK